jgi:hypothetical protein
MSAKLAEIIKLLYAYDDSKYTLDPPFIYGQSISVSK